MPTSHDNYLEDCCGTPMTIQPSTGSGYTKVWYMPEWDVWIIESMPAFHYLMFNRFYPPDVIIHYFTEIMRVAYSHVESLKGRIIFPVYEGARPLRDGLPLDITTIPIQCKRRLNPEGDRWEAQSKIIGAIPMELKINSNGSEAHIKGCAVDECGASGRTFRNSLEDATLGCIEIAGRLIGERDIQQVTLELNLFCVWISRVALERVRRFFESLRIQYSNDSITIMPLATPIVCMGISELTNRSGLYGFETGLPIGNKKTIISRSFAEHVSQLTQGSDLCAVGDVGKSVGNLKDQFDDPRVRELTPVAHRAGTLVEVKYFGIDTDSQFWKDRTRRIWSTKGVQTYLMLKSPDTFEFFASKYGASETSRWEPAGFRPQAVGPEVLQPAEQPTRKKDSILVPY